MILLWVRARLECQAPLMLIAVWTAVVFSARSRRMLAASVRVWGRGLASRLVLVMMAPVAGCRAGPEGGG